MSYDLHEAYSLDSFQDRLLFWDDFEGDALKDLWTTTESGGGGGTATVVDAQDGGIVRLLTGATSGDDWILDWGGGTPIRSLLVSKRVTIEIRLRINESDTTKMDAFFGLYGDGSNTILFIETSTVWNIYSRSGGTITQASSGVTRDTDWHIYKIECFPTGEVHFYIDGTETSNSPITSNIPSAYLRPYFFWETNENVAHSMDIDYVYVRQDR